MNTNPSSNKGFLNIFILLILITLLAAGAFFFIFLRNKPTQVESPEVVENTVVIPEQESVDAGYENYVDANLGFSLAYPDKYRLEEDGAWENSVLILYSGGQSYDLIVQVWDTEAEYKEFFADTPSADITVHVVDGKYVTLLNVNEDPEIDAIIESFK